MGCLKGLDSIPGRMAAFTVETSNRVSETDMEYGTMRERVANAIKGTICSIKSTAMVYMTGQMDISIKVISSRTKDVGRVNSSITTPLSMMDFG